MEREIVKEAIVSPTRLLSDESTARLLEMLQYVPGLKNVIFQGPNCPPRDIKIGDQFIELSVTVNGLYIEIEDEDVINDIKAVCKEALPCGFNVEFREYPRPSKMSTRASRVQKDLGTLKRD